MASDKRYEYVLPVGYVLRGGANDYVIEQVLGKGGFGVTYKVKASVLYMNIPIDAYFAVKEFFPDICSREADNATIKIPETKRQEIADGKKDFINEGKKLQEVCKLNPNIVNVNEVFQANGTAYYVLEYLEGGDLRKMVKNNGKPLTERQMLDVMLPIGHAVQCLHDNRMLHLDIKPDNIVMRRNNKGNDEPALIDFGIAMHFYSDGTPSTNTPSQGITPGYSPIEQYSQVKKFDPRIDVYSFAATCFYLLTGKDPIEATDMPQDFIKNELPQGVSANVAAAIERGMAMTKNTRVASINELLSMMTGTPIKVEKKGNLQPKTVKEKVTVNLKEKEEALKLYFEPEPKPSGLGKKLLVVLSILAKRCRSNYVNTKTFTVNGVSFTMVAVPGGTFIMGATSEQGSDADSDETPTHSVTLSSYYIGQTEVTQELWEAVMGSNPSEFKGAKRPVEWVSWNDCQEFIRKLNAKTGKQFRLPTEAEWEYAARGGKSGGTKYSGSNRLRDVAWNEKNSGDRTHKVATKQANELGIYDMSGNVWEWCSDWYGDYSSSSQTDPRGATEGSSHVMRGGCFANLARSCRVSTRGNFSPDHRWCNLGVRLAL